MRYIGRSRLILAGVRNKICLKISPRSVKAGIKKEIPWFCEVDPLPKNYVYLATGRIWATRKSALHYIGIRPFEGVRDPVLSQGLELRATLLPILLQAERKETNRKLVQSLFQLPPTHVLRLGWRSILTGDDHDILFIPLRFNYEGLAPSRLAWECAIDLSDRLNNTEHVQLLCPEPKTLRNAQVVWMSFLFFRFRGVTVDRFLVP